MSMYISKLFQYDTCMQPLLEMGSNRSFSSGFVAVSHKMYATLSCTSRDIYWPTTVLRKTAPSKSVDVQIPSCFGGAHQAHMVPLV